MSSGDISSLHQLLKTAEGNLQRAESEMRKDSISPDTLGLRSSVRMTMLAVQQTINAVHKVLDDL